MKEKGIKETGMSYLGNKPGVIKISFFIMAASIFTFYSLFAAEVFYVLKGSNWHYFKGTEAPSNPQDEWTILDFDDSAWSEGPAPFGYDTRENFDFGKELTDMQGNYITCYLRIKFQVPDPAAVSKLELRIFFDDGFVTWINGTEVKRENVPEGDVPYNVGGTPQSYEPEEVTFGLPDPSGYIVTGTNIITVLMVNRSMTSSDFMFDLALVDPVGIDQFPPVVEKIFPVSGTTVRKLEEIKVTFDENVTGVDGADLLVNNVPALNVSGSGKGPYVFTISEPAPGTLEISWSPGHGITDTAPLHNEFEGLGWDYNLDPDAPPGDLVINEILASNKNNLLDEDGDSPDWIEIYNRSAESVVLTGWSLTDNPGMPAKWTFPDISIDPEEYLLVFASGKDRKPLDGELHTNFQLNGSGDYLGLFTPGSPPKAAGEFSPQFPKQQADYSYGLNSDGVLRYFQDPTPGKENNSSSAFSGFVAKPKSNMPHGLYEDPFHVELSCETPGSKIYYTLAPEGRDPNDSTGILYETPILVQGTSQRRVVTLRAIAYKDGDYLPSVVNTYTYIFPAFVTEQDNTPEGFPAQWGNGTIIPGDYELDPRIMNNSKYKDQSLEALTTAPTMSIVMDIDDMFEYDALKHNSGTIINGNGSAWNRMFSMARQGLASNLSYEAIQEYLDVPDLCDYMIMNLYACNTDWAHQNWYAGRNRVQEGAMFRFFSWDAEHVLKLHEGVTQNVLYHNDEVPKELFHRLRANPEFNLLYADHVQKHFFNGGVLYVDPSHTAWDPQHPERNMPAAIYMERIREIDSLIVLESARWGDARVSSPYTRDNWVSETNYLLSGWFPKRSAIVLEQFRAAGLYPSIDAPVFSKHGGTIEPGFSLSMTKPPVSASGTIYFTTDGTDPREYGTGNVSTGAQTYSDPVVLNNAGTVKARIKIDDKWSALNEAEFTLPSAFDFLKITEIMYNPAPGDLENSNEYEFIELKNMGPATIDLSGVKFTEGIEYTFPQGASLTPGKFLVLASNNSAFEERYPGIEIAGVYSGRLDDDGDTVTIEDFDGKIILSFTYEDSAWWPHEADGAGYSLTLKNLSPGENLSFADSWRISSGLLGSPGADDNGMTGSAPVITIQPEDVTKSPGETATFYVLALGSPAPTYMWQKNSVDIPGAEEASYTTGPLQSSDNGAEFQCVITNSKGTVQSRAAILTILSTGPQFIRGDANSDGKIDLSDAVGILSYLFAQGGFSCKDAGNVNDDGFLNLGDPVSLLSYLFSSTAPPPVPFPACGTDPTGDGLNCESFLDCE